MNSKVFQIIRKLSRSNYWQTVYSHSRESSGFYLFKNNFNFGYAQLIFLNFLSFYSSLYLDIALGEVTEIVFKDEIYEDSYMYWKNQKNSIKKGNNLKLSEHKNRELNNQYNSTSWVFKRPKKVNN